MNSPTAPENARETIRWLEEHGTTLYRYAYSKVRRADVAEDLVQETLLAAWRNHEKFDGNSQVRTWLIAILKNKTVDWLRASIREQNRVPLPDDTWLNEQFNTIGKWRTAPKAWAREMPQSESERTEFWDAIRSCLDQLPTRLRQVFVLWQLEEQPSDDVCKAADISASNLWVMLHRSRIRLSRCLTGKWSPNAEAQPESDIP